MALRLAMKDVTAGSTGPTTNNEITVTRYHVRDVRSDGRNTQGVDVPAGEQRNVGHVVIHQVAEDAGQEDAVLSEAVEARPVADPRNVGDGDDPCDFLWRRP